MAPTVHVIDPDADTLIILRSACTSFAKWVEPAGEVANEDTNAVTEASTIAATPGAKDSRKGLFSFEVQRPFEETPHNLRVPGTPMQEKRLKTLIPFDSTSHALYHSESKPNTAGEREVHYSVSLRHLQLASPWFKRAMAKEGWAESKVVDGRYRILAHDWDEQALLIVLNIFHLRHKKVPRSVTLEMLAKIGTLADYYECGEALELFTAVWIEKFDKTAVPDIYCRDLILWIWVSWVFDLPTRFADATSVAINQSTEVMHTLDLPIPPSVSSEIDLRRYQAIEAIIDGLHKLLDGYQSGGYRCKLDGSLSFQCSSFLLGALTKQLNDWSLLSPRPEVPFSNLSFNSICTKARRAKSPAWAAFEDRTGFGSYYRGAHGGAAHSSCSLTQAVVDVVNKACSSAVGLSLSEMRANPKTLDETSARKTNDHTVKQSFDFGTTQSVFGA